MHDPVSHHDVDIATDLLRESRQQPWVSEPLIDVDKAAAILGRPPKWLYVEAAAGRLPSYKIGGKRKFRASELDAYIQRHAQGPRMATLTPLPERRR